MSNHYTIACLTCEQDLLGDSYNRQDEALQYIVDNKEVFSKLNEVAVVGFTLAGMHLDLSALSDEEHKSHSLFVKSEYETFAEAAERLAAGVKSYCEWQEKRRT